MFILVCAEKGPYDSNIEVYKKGYTLDNRKEASRIIVDNLVSELSALFTNQDYINYSINNTKEDLKAFVENVLENKVQKIDYNNKKDCVILEYNRIKNFLGYTISGSPINEYKEKVVKLIAV